MDIRVIATDMDGTLLDSQGRYPKERFEKLLESLEKRGIRLVIATGNHLSRMRLLFGDLMGRLSFVAANGTVLVEQGRVFSQRFWTRAMVQDCLAYFHGKLRSYHVIVGMEEQNIALEGTDFSYVYQLVSRESAEGFLSRIQYVASFDDLPLGNYLRVSLMLKEAEVEDVIRQFNQTFQGRFVAVTSGYGSVDILETGIHKAWGLEQLLTRWDMSASQLMAFGDSNNDVEMLELAAYSYAMDNGDEAAKLAANALAPTNDQAGVLQVIENYLKDGEK
ncbi:Cof-type HAD-IIB family hydrolase [Streptococcus pneumoniae]